MSKIEVNQVDPQSGTTLTLGTSGDTVSIPSGVTLANAGTATGFASIAWQSSIVTAATHTAAAGQGLWLDTSSNAITLTLPASPSVGDQVIFTDYARNWGTNAITLNLNSEKFQGNTTPVPVYDTNGESVNIVYSGSTKGWIPNTDGEVALETPQTYALDFLVIAGGGGGGSYYYGGGGGAGGFRISTQTSGFGNTITVTVGDGGAVGSGNGGKGTDGGNSSISGSGFTTITSTGGGGGGSDGSPNKDGRAGGSGGGGSGYSTGSGNRGFGNTPSTSPSQGNDGGYNSAGTDYGGGGGGGAGVVGGISSNDNGAAGGAGTASSITGASVTRAGGGGGSGGENNGTAGVGGAGGGGLGARQGPATAGSAGTVNTGGGGGATADPSAAGGAGGKGVIILSMPSANFSGTTTGSPTEDIASGKKILTFTGSGSYVT